MKIIKRTIEDKVAINHYYVQFKPVYNNICNPGEHDDCIDHGCVDNGRMYLSDIDAELTKITEDNYLDLGVQNLDTTLNTSGVCGDTQDIRPKIFRTKKEAQEHINYTVHRFNNPEVWECFFTDSV